MKLFFETSGQAACFLIMMPVGFALALLLDADVITGWFRPAADILLLLLTGAACLWVIAITAQSGLRWFHILGLLLGAVLYTCGAGRLIRLLCCKLRSARQEKRRRPENILHSDGKE